MQLERILGLEDDGVSVLDQLALSRHINSTHPSGVNEFHAGDFVDVAPPDLEAGPVLSCHH